jgi:ATP-dependent RNA helicase DDX27
VSSAATARAANAHAMAVDDFIMTIDSDTEDPLPPVSTKKHVDAEEASLNPAFTFDLATETYMDILDSQNELRDLIKTGSRPVSSLNHCGRID